jgi:hypothetical protein
MNLVTRLVLFGIGLSALLGVYKVAKSFSNDHKPEVHVVVDAASPDPDEIAAIAADAATASAEAAMAIAPPQPPDAPDAPALADPAQIRIVTTNRAAFLSLRGNYIVAGFTDSLQRSVRQEIAQDMKDESKVGRLIGEVVASGVSKVLGKELAVPLAEVRDIEYDGHRIAIDYRRRQKDALITLESLKGDGDKTLLEQFSEADARRFVEAVKVRIR